MVRTAALYLVILLSVRSMAQLPAVDITWAMLPTDQIEVRMRPDGPFSSLFSSCVFTVRWLDSGVQGLGSVQQVMPYQLCVPVAKSGGEQVSGGYRYQVFYGSSLLSFQDAELAWEGGQEYVVCIINTLGGAASFEIVNDEWTGLVTNNGDYYVSLEGQDRTGEIYTLFTGVDPGPAIATSVRMAPNPAAGGTQLFIERAVEADDVLVALRDASGRVVWSQISDLVAGTRSIALDLAGLAAGSYVVEVNAPEGMIAQRLIVVEH